MANPCVVLPTHGISIDCFSPPISLQIIHDYEHAGFNNDFLINTGDEMAVRYNDRHVRGSTLLLLRSFTAVSDLGMSCVMAQLNPHQP